MKIIFIEIFFGRPLAPIGEMEVQMKCMVFM
jgi:hypothetical protein